ncbi:MAG: ATP-binding cassette domain-containing protein [Robiginitomaculum sp.]|nr:ATP-binding cassette domain-containing protein [Robiginitomaculum sp.]
MTKSFGDNEPVVCGIDFDIEKGKCFGFLGPNGAGKTTTLRMIQGVSPISSGKLSVFGYELPKNGKKIRARLGIVPQDDNLDPDFTVIENLRMYGIYFGVPRDLLETRINALLEFMHLQDRARDKPEQLSGGMKRRLTIARALVNDPELIILDEPTTGLDPQVRHIIWAKLRELMTQGKSIVMTTHYMDEAERLCDELIIMDSGKILDQGSPANIVNRHVESHVVEVRGNFPSLTKNLKKINSVRLEKYGDTLFCYTNQVHDIVNYLASISGVHYFSRSCNLEDVFLTMTGRELRE